MNWRIARFYAPSYEIFVMTDVQNNPPAMRVRREKVTGMTAAIPVPRGGRILWMLERDGAFHRALLQVQPNLPGGTYLSYTDVDAQTQPFRVMNFEFVPTDIGDSPQ